MGDDMDTHLEGAVDLHVHPAPSPFPRRLGILDAASEAADAGFSTIAVKSHHHSMVSDVLAVEGVVGTLPLEVLSGVCLNHQVGGVNPYAVELALQQGGRFVWFPTISAANHVRSHSSLRTFPNDRLALGTARPIHILGADGALRSEALEVLELIRDADAVLACGHLDVEEIDVLIGAALAMGIGRIMVNHPNFVVGADPSLCASWASRGVFIEHSLCHYVEGSTFRKWDLDTLFEYIHAVGVGHTVLSSDLGQVGNPTPVEGFQWVTRRLAEAQFDALTIRRLVGASARSLIS